MLFLEGVYPSAGANPPVFRPVAAAGTNELRELAEQIAARVGQVPERRYPSSGGSASAPRRGEVPRR
jgi:hypothetical protein